MTDNSISSAKIADSAVTVSRPHLTAEQLDQMIASDNVRMRDLGVIAKWLAEHFDNVGDPILAARSLIKAQTAAGLGTFVVAEVQQVMRDVAARARRKAEQTTDVEPYHGKAVDTGMVTSRVRLTRDEFAALARGEYRPGDTPLHGPPQTVVDPPITDA